MPDGDARSISRSAAPRADLPAERAVLGAILLDGGGERAVLAKVAAILKRDDFWDPRHSVIYEAFTRIAARREPIDVLTTAAELRAMERLNTVGGAQYLGELTDEIPTVAHCESHARLIAEHAIARRVEAEAHALVAASQNHGTSTGDLVAVAQRALDAASARVSGALVSTTGDAVEEEMARLCADVDVTVRPTGIEALDQALCGGMREGDLVVPGGRPSSGKSALGFQIAWSLAAQGWPVVVVSLEMPRISVIQRIVAQRIGADLGVIRARAFRSQQEINAYCAGLEAARALPLRIIDKGDLTPSELRAVCLAERARAPGGKLGAVIFDYLQKGKPDHEQESREQEIASISRALKNLAKELKCPIVAPAQLNRGLEGRAKRGGDDEGDASSDRPRMSDFRGSGEIEQEADIMIGIHRPAKAPHTRELWVLKQRNGPTDGVKVDLVWQGPSARFVAAPQTDALPLPDDSDAPEGV